MVQITPRQTDMATTATVRALSSLTQRDAAAVRATVRATGNLHRVEEHDDYDGYLSLVLTPLDAGGGPGFLVCGRAGAVDLAELRGDEMEAIGRYPSIGAAMLTLRGALEQASEDGEAERLLARHGSDAGLHAAMRADAEEGGRWRAVIRAIDLRDDS